MSVINHNSFYKLINSKTKMKTRQYSEFSEKYPAIDGIKKDEKPSREERKRIKGETGKSVAYRGPDRQIRSDVEKILEMDGIAFDSWYRKKESAVLNLLNPIRIAATIPDLRYGAEYQQYNLDVNSNIDTLHKTLEEGLKYLEVIKKVREERNK